jgi:hypothetical protein
MLDLQRVPPPIRALLPLAERFGIADDGAREQVVRAADPHEVRALVASVREHDDALDMWLSGPEAAGPEWTDEYIAFSAMRMAADSAA